MVKETGGNGDWGNVDVNVIVDGDIGGKMGFGRLEKVEGYEHGKVVELGG